MNSESKVSQKELSLTNEEQLSYQYLKQHSNEWAELFLNILPDGRDKITARLMGSLYRENLVGGYTHSQIVAPHLLSSDLKQGRDAQHPFSKTRYFIVRRNHWATCL